jgi:5-methylcytosine-specific restriction protein B
VTPDLAQVPIQPELDQICKVNNITMKTSFGMGTATVIPWLACFYPGQSASKEGIYPVILYRRDTHTLSVCYGVSATTQAAEGNWPRQWPMKLIQNLPFFGHKKYGGSYELHLFQSPEIENYSEITDSFLHVIDDFLALPLTLPTVKMPLPLPEISLNKFQEQSQADFLQAGLRISRSLLIRLASSLLAKRFLILTGLSGSGKTKLAHAFAAWIAESKDQYRLIAVGADWTTNENVVGYQDALQPGTYRKPSNGALDMILRAENDSARPYFLILDEMNLSHVERYFADILSAVESGEEIALHSAAENLKASDDDTLPVPAKLRLPDNLFIVGTVNVDETTYMFSPKVLDRANVIEFRATAGDIADFLDAPAKVDMDTLAGKGAAFGPAFVAEARTEAQLGSVTAADLKARLTEIFVALAPIGAEFGFRTAYEITRFTHFHTKLTGDGWQFKDALDAQVLQKLMPKLHGSERKLGPVLEMLHGFCSNYHCDSSLVKIERMQNRLRTDGFTSFAEA